MKKLYKFAAVAIAAMLLVNCTENELDQPVTPPAQVGDEILFGGRAGFASDDADTRTEYSGEYYTIGEGEQKQKYERIDWTNGDIVEIYSPNTSNKSNSIYNVISEAGDSGEQNDYAYLTRISDSNMYWADDSEHTFYAVYPSAMMFNQEATVLMGYEMEGQNQGVTLSGTIPSSQQPIEIVAPTGTGTVYEAKPDMRYAYMVAGTKTSREAGVVGLSFLPIVTAVEIELYFKASTQDVQTISIGEIQVVTKAPEGKVAKPLTGPFTATISNDWGTNKVLTTVPECEIPNNAQTGNTIQVTTRMYNSQTDIDEPIHLTPGQSLRFTVFMLPNQNIDNLEVRFSDGVAGYLSHELKGLTVTKQRKTRIMQLQLPTEKANLTAANWMDMLLKVKPEIAMKGLSLPGTGGSFTYNNSGLSVTNRQQYAQGDNEIISGTKREKAMDFDKQWELGIRAFEITSDRPSMSNVSGTASLGDQNITCNQQSVSMKVSAAMQKIIDKIKAPLPEGREFKETALVIFVYQPQGNNPCRNANFYARALANFYDEMNNANPGLFKLYTPELKLKDAAGHILLMARINQRGEGESTGNSNSGNGTLEDAANNWTAAKERIGSRPIVLIDGCGTAKDRWGTRGYTYYDETEQMNVPFADISNPVSERAKIIEYYMEGNADYLYGPGTSSTSYPFGSVTPSYTNSSTTYSTTITRPDPTIDDPMKEGFGLNFDYDTYAKYEASELSFKCWYQDWSRVVAKPTNKEYSKSTWYATYRYSVKWFESYYEKLDHALTTFDMAVNNVKFNGVLPLYINSLCGYLVDETIPESYGPSVGSVYGGSGGDIQGLAKKIVPPFYQHVLQASQANESGPMGVVMLDYVSDNPAEGGAYYLPGLIFNNNLKSDITTD